MNHHGIEIFALRVHVQRSVDGMKIETTLNEIHQLDIEWNSHTRRPIYSKQRHSLSLLRSFLRSLTIPDEKGFLEVIVALSEQIDIEHPRTGVEQTLPG